MLNLKKGICIDCPIGSSEKKLVGGRCSTHYFNRLRLASRTAANPSNPYRIVSNKQRVRTYSPQQNNDGDKEWFCSDLNEWFSYHIENSINVCENCGGPIPWYNEQVRRSAQAHILPKKIFLSLATCIPNHMVLASFGSDCNCHNSFDLSWQRASRMPIFEIAKTRFLTFKHLIAPAEVSMLPDVFKTLM